LTARTHPTAWQGRYQRVMRGNISKILRSDCEDVTCVDGTPGRIYPKGRGFPPGPRPKDALSATPYVNPRRKPGTIQRL
jgi:hypothetical protein